ncbi:ATP-binding response regulator [Polaribacter sp.]|uniref:ATP-binding response regulator n=1 Tax=Polaribacter sp. TaxID=1920175 RepID=UPI003F6A366E
MITNRVNEFFIALETNFEGEILNIVEGNFLQDAFRKGDLIHDKCPFLALTLTSLPNHELLNLEGMLIDYEQEFNVDVDLFKENQRISIVIYDRTNIYKSLSTLNQSRNDLYFLKRELAQKNKELEIQRALADKANAEKSRFLAMMSHEIRNPLNVILGYTELIHKEKTSLMAQEYLKYLSISGRNLKVIVDDILDLSRVEAGKLHLVNDTIQLKAIIHQIKNNYKTCHKDLDVALFFNISDDLPEFVLGDDVRLIQILTNLINNSIKFTSKGSVTTTVKLLFSDAEKALISFQVKDTGRGMTEEQASKIFEEYQQNRLSDHKIHKGVGLGLSIVKRLVSLMGGRIKVDSAKNYGTLMVVDIPFQLSLNHTKKNEVVVAKKKTISLKGKRILVADDSFLNLKIVSHILESEKVQYTLVKDGVEAIKAMDSSTFDMVLLDINMPNLKGDELIMRKEEMKRSNADIPYLALTANNAKEDVSIFKSLGFSGVIPKPFTAKQFIHIIKEHLL